MANVKISQLPEYTGNTSGSWLIMNNSGETTTYKVKKENVVPAGGGLFAQTGSFWNTTNNIGITGSLNVSGSASLATNPSLNVVGNIRFTNPPGVSSYQNVIEFSSGSVPESGSVIQYLPSTDVLLLKGYRNNSIVSIGQINGKNNIIGNTTVTGSFSQSGSVYITGSVQGNVNALTISSNTASLNLDNGNFFTLQLVSGSATHINPSNIKPGQTANMIINTTGSVTVNFPSSVKQPSGSAYVPSVNGSDVLTFVSFDNSTLYVANVRNLI